jgi:hypothetical protein
MSGYVHQFASSVLGPVTIVIFFYVLVDLFPMPRWLSKKAQLIGQRNPESITSLECPYSYIHQIYGKYYWAPFVHKLSPTLKDNDQIKYKLVLETMDAIHLCLILVDDVCIDHCPSGHISREAVRVAIYVCANASRYLMEVIFARDNPQLKRSTAHQKLPIAHIIESLKF